jgi:glutaredoxin
VKVVIYTRAGCPLCTKGITTARSVFGIDNVTLVDVDLDLGLLETYTNRVPVIETEDGEVIDEGIVDERRLRTFRAT